MMSLLEAANAKLDGGEALDRRSAEVYGLISSPCVRKLMDPSCPEDGKRRKVTDEWSKQDEISFIDDMKEQYRNLERSAADDPELTANDGCMTPPDQVDMNSSNSGSPKDVSPDMSAADVVESIGAMCSGDRGEGDHVDQTTKARKQSQVRKCLDDQGKAPVVKALNYTWAIPAIQRGLEGDKKAFERIKDPRVAEHFKLLMDDVNKGVMVVVHVQDHWFLIAKIDGEIRSLDVLRNGFCAFTCAFWIWRWSQKWDVDKDQNSARRSRRDRSKTPVGKKVADEHQTSQQETWAKERASIGVNSLADVMSIESMSQCIFESQAKEGVTDKQEHTRLQMENPETLTRAEELDHYHAMAMQIKKESYQTVRASDGTWMPRWALKFGVKVKGYAIRNYNGWTLEPMGWPEGEEAQEPNMETATLVVDAVGDQRTPKAKEGRLLSDAEVAKSVHKIVEVARNLSMPEAQSRRRTTRPSAGINRLAEESAEVSRSLAIGAVGERMLELYRLYAICKSDAVAVTDVVQTELNKRAIKHGISKQMIEQMQKKMTDSWVQMMERHEGSRSIEKYREAKKRWDAQQRQIRMADKQFAEQVEDAEEQAYLLFVPDKEYWDVLCPVCGCPVHTEEEGVCWSETVETITDVVLRTIATVQEVPGSVVPEGSDMMLGLFSREMEHTCLRKVDPDIKEGDKDVKDVYQIAKMSQPVPVEVKEGTVWKGWDRDGKLWKDLIRQQEGETIRFPMYSAVIWGNFVDRLGKASKKDSEPIELEDAGLFTQALSVSALTDVLGMVVYAVHVGTTKVSGRLLNDKVRIGEVETKKAKFLHHEETPLEIDRAGEAKVVSWVPAGNQLFTYYGPSKEGDLIQKEEKWPHRIKQLAEVRAEKAHEKGMISQGGMSQEDIQNHIPIDALKVKYTREIMREMMTNMDTEMRMAEDASTHLNAEIDNDIREVRDYFKHTLDDESPEYDCLVPNRMEKYLMKNHVKEDDCVLREASQTVVNKMAVTEGIMKVSMKIEAKNQSLAPALDGAVAKQLRKAVAKETGEGDLLVEANKLMMKRDWDKWMMAVAPKVADDQGKAPVVKAELDVIHGVRVPDVVLEIAPGVRVLVTNVVRSVHVPNVGLEEVPGAKKGKKRPESKVVDTVPTPSQLREEQGYVGCALGKLTGKHSLSIINSASFRRVDEIPYDPKFEPAEWVIKAYEGKRMQFLAVINAAIKHNEGILKVWKEGVYCCEMARFITEYHDIYVKAPTDMGQPKKLYCVRCAHIKKDPPRQHAQAHVHCAQMGHRCMRMCAGPVEQFKVAADYHNPAERQACYNKGLPETWSKACTCRTERVESKDGIVYNEGCKCSRSYEAVMVFLRESLNLMPQMVSPLAYQTSGRGADVEPEYIRKLFEKDTLEVNARDGKNMDPFEYRTHLMRWFAVEAEQNPNRDPLGHEQETDDEGRVCGKSWADIQKIGGGTAAKHDLKWSRALEKFKEQAKEIERCCCLKVARAQEKSATKKVKKVKKEKKEFTSVNISNLCQDENKSSAEEGPKHEAETATQQAAYPGRVLDWPYRSSVENLGNQEPNMETVKVCVGEVQGIEKKLKKVKKSAPVSKGSLIGSGEAIATKSSTARKAVEKVDPLGLEEKMVIGKSIAVMSTAIPKSKRRQIERIRQWQFVEMERLRVAKQADKAKDEFIEGPKGSCLEVLGQIPDFTFMMPTKKEKVQLQTFEDLGKALAETSLGCHVVVYLVDHPMLKIGSRRIINRIHTPRPQGNEVLSAVTSDAALIITRWSEDLAHCVLIKANKAHGLHTGGAGRLIADWDQMYFGNEAQEDSCQAVADKKGKIIGQTTRFPCNCVSCKKANSKKRSAPGQEKVSKMEGVYWDADPWKLRSCGSDNEAGKLSMHLYLRAEGAESGETELEGLWTKLKGVKIQGLPCEPQADIQDMTGDQELNADQQAMIHAWYHLDMEERLAQVAVAQSTRYLFKQYARSDDTGFAIVAPEEDGSDTQESVVEAGQVWFSKHNKGREAVRIVRSNDKLEIEMQSRLFYRASAVKKGNVKVKTHLPIITPETAKNLGYVAAIPISDLILYNMQKELIGACTTKESIASRVLEVEESWMEEGLDVQFAGCFVAIRADHEDEVWNDRDFRQWKRNMQSTCYGPNTIQDGVSKMRACSGLVQGAESEEIAVGNTTECLATPEETGAAAEMGTLTDDIMEDDVEIPIVSVEVVDLVTSESEQDPEDSSGNLEASSGSDTEELKSNDAGSDLGEPEVELEGEQVDSQSETEVVEAAADESSGSGNEDLVTVPTTTSGNALCRTETNAHLLVLNSPEEVAVLEEQMLEDEVEPSGGDELTGSAQVVLVTTGAPCVAFSSAGEGTVEANEEDSDGISSAVTIMKDEIIEMQHRVEVLEKKKEAQLTVIGTLKERLRESDAVQSKMQEAKKSTEAQLDETKVSLAFAVNKAEKLQKDIDASSELHLREIGVLQYDLENAEVETTRRVKFEQDARSAADKKWAALLLHERKALERQIQSSAEVLEQRVSELESDCKRKDEEHEQSQGEIDLQQSIVREHEQRIDELEEKANELELGQYEAMDAAELEGVEVLGNNPDLEASVTELKAELETAECQIGDLQDANTQLTEHADAMTAKVSQVGMDYRRLEVELKDSKVKNVNSSSETEALRMQAGEQRDQDDSTGANAVLQEKLTAVQKELGIQRKLWEDDRIEAQKEAATIKVKRAAEEEDLEAERQKQLTVISDLRTAVRKHKDDCLSMVLSRPDNTEVRRLTAAVETLQQSGSDMTLEEAEEHALVRVLQQHEMDLTIATMNKVTLLQSKVTAQRVEASRLRKKLQRLDPTTYEGGVDDLEAECRTEELEVLIGRVGIAEIESDMAKAVEDFKDLVHATKKESMQALQMGHAVIKSFVGNQSVDQAPPQQWSALLARATEEGLVTTGVNKKNRIATKKGQTKKLALNVRVEGAVYKLVMSARKKDYALQQGINIIAVLRNQVATGMLEPAMAESAMDATNLTVQMEQLQKSLEAKDIECIRLMEQLEKIEVAKVRKGADAESVSDVDQLAVKACPIFSIGGNECNSINCESTAQLVEAQEEIVRLNTKVEELDLKAKTLKEYKAEHGIPESAVELKQKVEELQGELRDGQQKINELEWSIEVMVKKLEDRNDQIEEVVDRHQKVLAEKQVLQAEAVVDRGIAANFAEELETAEQLRKETEQVMNGLKVELDVRLRRIDSYKEDSLQQQQQVEGLDSVINVIRGELREAKFDAECGFTQFEELERQEADAQVQLATARKRWLDAEARTEELEERAAAEKREIKRECKLEVEQMDEQLQSQLDGNRTLTEQKESLQLEANRLRFEEPQDIVWCSSSVMGQDGNHISKVKCAIKKLQIGEQTRICIIHVESGVAQVLPFKREESYAAQIIEEARVKGWWVCSHEEAARIMGKTVAQTVRMWEVNTQASKVWTLRGGEEVSIKLLSDEGELVWRMGVVTRAVPNNDGQCLMLELDSGSVMIHQIKEIKVLEDSQQQQQQQQQQPRARPMPAESPATVFSGDHERSSTRRTSNSLGPEHRREDQEEEPESPSEPAFRARRSKSRRSGSRRDRHRWNEDSERGRSRWNEESDSDSGSDYSRKNKRNAEDKRANDGGSACTTATFQQRKAAEKLQETCRKKKLKERLAKCGNNTTASIVLFKQAWSDICSDEILYDNRVPLYALATVLFKIAPEKSMFQSIIQDMIFEPEESPGMCEFKPDILKAHEKPNFRKWICENVYHAMTGENWGERGGDRVRANDVELVRRCGDARALGRFLKQHTADLMEKAAFKKKEAYIEAVAETTRKIGWETAVAVTLHIHKVRQVFANFDTEEGRAAKFEELMLEIYGGVAEEHRSLLKHVTSNPDKFDRTYENAQQWLTLEYVGQEVFNEIPVGMRARGPRRGGNGRGGMEVAETRGADEWSQKYTHLEDIDDNDSKYNHILEEFNIARKATEEHGFDTVFCDSSRERVAVIKALEASGGNSRVYFSEDKKPASQGHRGVDKPDPRSEASLAYVVPEARLREVCKQSNSGSKEYTEHYDMMCGECDEHPPILGRKTHRNYQCCSVFHKFRHSPWMVLSYDEKATSWNDCGMLSESDRRENRKGLTRTVTERDRGMPCCRNA